MTFDVFIAFNSSMVIRVEQTVLKKKAKRFKRAIVGLGIR